MKRSPVGDAVFALVLLASTVLAGVGITLVVGDPMPERRMLGSALLAVGGIAGLASVGLMVAVRQIRLSGEETARLHEQTLATLTDRLGAITVLLHVISEQQLISDRAKAIAYREKDREALRRAIREESAKGDWEAARVLVSEMEATFGSRQEADRYRAEIDDAYTQTVRRSMQDVQDRIDRLCRAEDWQGAHQEASRFIADHPDFEPARRLPADIEQRKQNYKRQLMDRWNDCVARHDGDTGIEILRLLDPYLTPAEAERMAESARSIFNDRKARLRDQFTAAATAQDWVEALRVGETIQREFPNAKFAQEISDMMPTLRERAAEQTAAAEV